MVGVPAMFSLSGRSALITGGSRGLGFQLARGLGQAGARVLISARKEAGLINAVERLRALGIDAHMMAANCADAGDITRLADHALSMLGKVDILINNAGAVWSAPAESHPLEAWDKVMAVNVRGYFLLSQAIAVASMIPQRGGRIVNIGSIAGLGGNPTALKSIAYNTSKGAVHNFTRALAAEWGMYGITVNAIAPGFFPTQLSAGALADGGDAQIKARTPLKRLGDDEDLIGACLLFTSDAGKHITGQCLAIDGGASIVIH
jgi:NAD(P)-dependent dehydrogenase (short-subunit alcohol dehydrogenase family)